MATIYPASYTTVDDVYQTLPQIGSVSNVTSINIAYQIGRVEAGMNARLADTFTLPFSQNILQLTTIATDLTIYELGKRFSVLSNLKGMESLNKYKDASKTLDMIVSGKIKLLDSSNQAIDDLSVVSDTPWSNNMTYTPTFGEGTFSAGEIDPDK